MIKNYFKIAYRSLLKNRLYSLINIGGLALGMATATMLFLWVQNELSFDSYHKNSENIYRINTHLKINDTETWHWASTPYKLADYLKENIPEIEKSTRLFTPWGDFNFILNHEVFAEKKVAFVDNRWFDVFDYQFVKGNPESFKKDNFSMIISEKKAQELFPDENPIGKVIQHDSLLFTIGAVVQNSPSNSSFQYDFIFNNASRLSNTNVAQNDELWNNFNYQTFILSSSTLKTKEASEKLTKFLKKTRNSDEDNTNLELQKLPDIHFDNVFQSIGLASAGDKTVVNIFSLVAIFILLIACINYINLTTAKASQRIKEVSIKKMIGATKMGLFNQFVIESFITSFIAACIGLLLISLGLPLLNNISDSSFSFQNNPIVFYILGGITLVSILLTGIYPSLFISSFNPIQSIKGTLKLNTKSSSFRKGLVVFQFTFTVVLLMSTLLIFRQLKFIQNKPLGYEKEHIFTITIPWNVPNSSNVGKTIYEKLKGESSIKDVTLSNSSIVNVLNTHSGSLNWPARDTTWNPTTSLLKISPNYKKFYNLKLSEGRWITDSKADESNFILNETAIRAFKIPKPWIGQSFEVHGIKGEIVGIVKDFHFKSLKEAITPIVLYHDSQGYMSTINVKVFPSQYQKALAFAQATWKELAPNNIMIYEFLDDTFNNLHKNESKQLKMFNAFAGIVLLISCFGLFGLATFASEVRTKEIGIRKVMGASVGSIVNLLSKDFLILVIISILVAAPIAWWAMNKWLQQFAYHINFDGSIVLLASILVVTIAFLTVSYQAVRAALLNPVKSLKVE
jgi:putative ABC transport system permease protein